MAARIADSGPRNAVNFSSGMLNVMLAAIAAIMVSIVRSIGGYKPPFPIPEKQSAECIKAYFPELWKIQLQNFILRFP
jgi:hypothetical protein